MGGLSLSSVSKGLSGGLSKLGSNINGALEKTTDALGLTNHDMEDRMMEQAEENSAFARDQAEQANALAKEQWNYWKDHVAPQQQDQMTRQAELWDYAKDDFNKGTDDLQNTIDATAGEAASNTLAAMEREADANRRRMMGMGIDPSSARFQALDRADGLRRAAASADAGNDVRIQGMSMLQQADDNNFSKLSNALGQGTTMGNYSNNFGGNALSSYGGLSTNALNNASTMFGTTGTMARFNTGFNQDMFKKGAEMAGAAFGGMNDGGEVDGPGTSISDSIPAMLSDGEYVLPADVVEKIGVENLDRLVAEHHVPADMQKGIQMGLMMGAACAGKHPMMTDAMEDEARFGLLMADGGFVMDMDSGADMATQSVAVQEQEEANRQAKSAAESSSGGGLLGGIMKAFMADGGLVEGYWALEWTLLEWNVKGKY